MPSHELASTAWLEEHFGETDEARPDGPPDGESDQAEADHAYHRARFPLVETDEDLPL